MNKGNKMPRIFIIRWSGPVKFRNGKAAYMQCHPGPETAAWEYAERVAKENGVTVEAVV